MARFVLHEEALDDVDVEPLLRRLADEVATDARQMAPKRTGGLAASIRVGEVTNRHATVIADAENPNASEGHQPYAYWVEKGTSDTRAQPFLRPALYRYRSP